jgi:hypothetical protein
MARIPTVLHEHLNTAHPTYVCLVGTVQPDGYAQISPRGSTMVFDDEHFGLWERGRGTTNAALTDGAKVTIFFRKSELRQAGILPRGGVARFYGTAEVHRSGPVYDTIWERLVPAEKKNDPDKQGYGVLVRVERAEDLAGQPLRLD